MGSELPRIVYCENFFDIDRKSLLKQEEMSGAGSNGYFRHLQLWGRVLKSLIKNLDMLWRAPASFHSRKSTSALGCCRSKGSVMVRGWQSSVGGGGCCFIGGVVRG